MHKFVTVPEMLAMEQAADASGLTYAAMLANAGRGLADLILNAYSQIENKCILGLIGKGNNGGDTLVALTHLAAAGWEAHAWLAAERPRNDPWLSGFVAAGGAWQSIVQDAEFHELTRRVRACGLLLDGLLGTGIALPLRDPYPAILQAVAAAAPRPLVLAVDCPSGVDCDTGAAAAQCLPADHTACMAAVKRGLLTFPAYSLVGQLSVIDIGLPPDLPPLAAIRREVLTGEGVRALLPPRPLDSHKGTFGRALIVGGARHYYGAPLLAGRAAFRSGAGWVTLATPEPLVPALAGHFPEATWLPLPHIEGSLLPDAVESLRANLERVSGLLIGPGIGADPDTGEFLRDLLSVPGLPPLVLDAEALRLLAALKNWPARLPPASVLTPHPGEMAALTGLTIEAIQADRLAVAEKHAAEWNCVVVLKGAFTVVAAPDGRTRILPVATPALARAGTGDVLAGLLTGLLAQGLPPLEAASAAVWLHAEAGLAAARRLGSTAGVLAGDLIEELPHLLPF